MAVKTGAVIIGQVVRVSSRDIPKTETRAAMTFTNLLVVGENTLADVTLGRGLVAPEPGTHIVGRITVGVFRDDDQITLEEYLEPAAIARELGVVK